MVVTNFCAQCGVDLRKPQTERFCGECGREFGLQTASLILGGQTNVADAPHYHALVRLIQELAQRFDFRTRPAAVMNFHNSPALDVQSDFNFEYFEGGSVSSESQSAIYDYAESSIAPTRLHYCFKKKSYLWDDGGESSTYGLSFIGISFGITVSREGLHSVLGPPTDSYIVDNFDRHDCWVLTSPSSGEPESLLVTYAATNPDIAHLMLLRFPEHL